MARAFALSVIALLSPTVVAAVDVTFTFVPPPDVAVKSVSLRGTMNDWGENAMAEADGVWSVTVDLGAGEYQYKFFVNGEWPQDMSEWNGGAMDADADDYVDDGFGGRNAIRNVGAGGIATAELDLVSAPELGGDAARVHYHRPDGDYRSWGLHLWEDTSEKVEWPSPLPPAGEDEYGLWWDVGLTESPRKVGLLIHRGDEKDPGPDQFLLIDEHGREIWIVSGDTTIHTSAPDVARLAFGDLSRRRTHWVTRDLILWNVRMREGATFRLHASADASLEITPDEVAGGVSIPLTIDEAGIPAEVRQRFPHLAGAALRLAPEDVERAAELLKGQLGVSLVTEEGLQDATGVQIPGVLDDLFSWDGSLGAQWEGGAPTVRVWAPTAKSVRLHLASSSRGEAGEREYPMAEESGVWSVTGREDWKGEFYRFEVEVFAPATGRIEKNLVTDPYSRSLSTNSRWSQLVDLDDAATKPDGWDELEKPALDAPEDIVLYELHVRDFSASDPEVSEVARGKFVAFTEDTPGTRHLRALAGAGLTHVHLLPSFDIATVDEDGSARLSANELAGLGPASTEQQAEVERVRGRDAYNWGYDPFHYGVPEGSYATNPDGSRRVVEFRRMVAALSGMGLRVVMDVVYNHTHASGQDERSVLDRIVPGYYHRLNGDGFVETSTCCQNTATEHLMMEKLMVDDLVHWARDYKVDGFRFDLMGHHMKRNLEKARDALHSLTPEEDGVDGGAIYLYGEGWDFGEVQGGKRGPNAIQPAMAGTGIGTFNDRIRDALRGGSPFGDPREQGFVTGIADEPSSFAAGSAASRGEAVRRLMDRIRVGLAGNLEYYRFPGRSGAWVRGGEHDNGGYTADPQEAINYVSAHDNETLFDKIQYAAAESASRADRVRMQRLGIDLVALGQGVPFFHAGVEMLRSKSMDRDSYDSGDWFNRLDFTYETNNFGVGLPPSSKNQDKWSVMRPLLANEQLRPRPQEIREVVEHFREMLRIRVSSPLFRLRSAQEVQRRVRFHNTGPGQTPGLIVMSLTDEAAGADLDEDLSRIVVLFNSRRDSQMLAAADWAGGRFELHPVQAEGADEALREARFDATSGSFTVPPRTTAVFVER